MQRNNVQPTFTDMAVADLGGPKATAFFERCLAEIPFERLAASVADIFKEYDPAAGKDPAAPRCFKSGRVYHGFRADVATDRNGVLTDYVYDTARVSEHEHFDHLARNEQQAVFADSGCRSKARLAALRQRGVTPAF